MTILRQALKEANEAVLRMRRSFFRGQVTEGRILKSAREALERRSQRRFDEILARSRKIVLDLPPGIKGVLERLLGAAKKLKNRVLAAAGRFAHPAWTKLKDEHWARIIETARSEKLEGNVKGAIREILLMGHELLENLSERMGSKLRKANTLLTRGKWVEEVLAIRGGLQRKGEANTEEIADILMVALADDPPPRIKGKTKRIWIMSIVESKSPTNRWDAYGQLRQDVRRIIGEGITLNGTYYAPDEIHIGLPKESEDPSEWVTELIAALPKYPKSAGKFGEVTKGTVMNVWELDVPEDEITGVAKLAEKEAADLGDNLVEP